MSTSLSASRAARRTRPRVAQLLAAPVVAAVVVLGVWVAGGVISNDFRLSIALTTTWFAISGIACLAIAIRSRALRIPVLAAYVLTAGVVGLYLGLSTLRDRVVDESVVVGVRAPAAVSPDAPAPAAPARANVELMNGRFRSGEHHTEGRAAVVRVRDGERFLTLTSFATSPGPDLRVRLVPGRSDDGGAKGAIDLGALKGNRGDQQYRLPAGARVSGATVVIWCRAFSVPFGSARLA